MITGECNCGAIQYEADTTPTGVYVCHCSICRRFTGTNGNAVIVVSNDDFRWVSGEDEISTWRKPGHDWQMWFCRVCGSQLPGENSPTTTFIPAGSITSGSIRKRVGMKSVMKVFAIGSRSIRSIELISADAGYFFTEFFDPFIYPGVLTSPPSDTIRSSSEDGTKTRSGSDPGTRSSAISTTDMHPSSPLDSMR